MRGSSSSPEISGQRKERLGLGWLRFCGAFPLIRFESKEGDQLAKVPGGQIHHFQGSSGFYSECILKGLATWNIKQGMTVTESALLHMTCFLGRFPNSELHLTHRGAEPDRNNPAAPGTDKADSPHLGQSFVFHSCLKLTVCLAKARRPKNLPQQMLI